MNFQRGNKAGSAADVALQMTAYFVMGMGLLFYSQDTCVASNWYRLSDPEEISCDKRFPSLVTFKQSFPKMISWRVTEACVVVNGFPSSVTL